MTAAGKASLARISCCVAAAGFVTGFFLLCTCPGWFFCTALAAGVAGWWGMRTWRLAGIALCITSLAIGAVEWREERKRAAADERLDATRREREKEMALALPAFVPVDFLTEEGAPSELLQTPVSGTFSAIPANEVILALCSQVRVNVAYGSNADGRPMPTFSGAFTEVALRLALFEVAYRAHLNVRWVQGPEGAGFISVSD